MKFTPERMKMKILEGGGANILLLCMQRVTVRMRRGGGDTPPKKIKPFKFEQMREEFEQNSGENSGKKLNKFSPKIKKRPPQKKKASSLEKRGNSGKSIVFLHFNIIQKKNKKK